MERGKVVQLVYDSIKVINEEIENKEAQLELEEETCLFGRESNLNSLKLVILLIDIEQRLANELGTEISISDEKAMSQERSPFQNIKSLVDYICSLEV